jgi:hypothetical protein
LLESGYDIGFFVQFLRSLAKARLDFQVLFEIVLTEFKETGPVAKELREEIWTRFKTAPAPAKPPVVIS